MAIQKRGSLLFCRDVKKTMIVYVEAVAHEDTMDAPASVWAQSGAVMATTEAR